MWGYNRNTDTYSNTDYRSARCVFDSNPGPHREAEYRARIAKGERPRLVTDPGYDDAPQTFAEHTAASVEAIATASGLNRAVETNARLLHGDD